MEASTLSPLLSFLLLALIMASARVSVVECATVLTLERAFPAHHRLDIDSVRARDRLRHSRLLQGLGASGVVDFSVQGSADPLLIGCVFRLLCLNWWICLVLDSRLFVIFFELFIFYFLDFASSVAVFSSASSEEMVKLVSFSVVLLKSFL